jgi:acyl carrier protein
MPINSIQLDDHRPTQRRVRHTIAEHNPAIRVPALSASGVGDVNDLVVRSMKNRQRANGSFVAQNPSRTPRWILAVTHRKKEDGAEQNPRGVEKPVAMPHRGYHTGPMTRAEIEEKLVTIVRNEKDVPDDKLSLETPLADAGIDSLDALSILFAIEEEFHISIPDDRARSMKTFGDMVDSIEALVHPT